MSFYVLLYEYLFYKFTCYTDYDYVDYDFINITIFITILKTCWFLLALKFQLLVI